MDFLNNIFGQQGFTSGIAGNQGVPGIEGFGQQQPQNSIGGLGGIATGLIGMLAPSLFGGGANVGGGGVAEASGGSFSSFGAPQQQRFFDPMTQQGLGGFDMAQTGIQAPQLTGKPQQSFGDFQAGRGFFGPKGPGQFDVPNRTANFAQTETARPQPQVNGFNDQQGQGFNPQGGLMMMLLQAMLQNGGGFQ